MSGPRDRWGGGGELCPGLWSEVQACVCGNAGSPARNEGGRMTWEMGEFPLCVSDPGRVTGGSSEWALGTQRDQVTFCRKGVQGEKGQ